MEDVLKKINSNIEQRIEQEIGSVKIKSYRLAEPVLVRDEEQDLTIPAIVDDKGECRNVFDNADMNDLVMYHRVTSTSFVASSGFGSSLDYSKISQISLIVYGLRKLKKDKVIDSICVELMKTDNVNLNSIDYDAIQILATEYSGLPYFLTPDYFLVRINFSLTKNLSTRCKK